ncbi:MAG: aminoacyl-tRNA hydrolase [Rickettsiales bacterium]|jgi:PTH1 family peptidyl-tRNA hydrolase|nr:aminoacyl-tRNA hydrolase [Rickettsiales bacterium]
MAITSNLLVAGLGNPGNEYAKTRHNAGFMAVDFLAGDAAWKKEKNYLITRNSPSPPTGKKGWLAAKPRDGVIGGQNIIFIKPQTFMNLSGAAVLAAMTKYKIPLENVIVIHDDIDLRLGDLRDKVGGGNAGHNGLKSISAAIGNDYRRLRIGIGRPENPEIDVADWVVGRFAKDELAALMKTIEGIRL